MPGQVHSRRQLPAWLFGLAVLALAGCFGSPEVSAPGVRIRPGELRLAVGDSQQLYLQPRESADSVLSDVGWTVVAGPAVIEISAAGALRALAPGTARVAASHRGERVTLEVQVLAGRRVATLAGGATAGVLGEHANGAAADSRFSIPTDLCFDETGNLFVSDLGNHCVRRIAPDGMVTDAAGSGSHDLAVQEFADGSPRASRFNRPQGVLWSPGHGLFIADTFNRRIRRLDRGFTRVETWAGTGSAAHVDGSWDSCAFLQPRSMALSSDGSVWIADGPWIRHLSPGRRVQSLGFPLQGPFRLGGEVDGIAVDPFGNLWVADYEGHRLLRRSPSGQFLSVGLGRAGFRDGGPGEARFNLPRGLAADEGGNIYVADSGNHSVRKVSPDGTVTTVAGTGRGTWGGVDGSARVAQFRDPWGVTIGPDGAIYVADTGNNLVRRIYLSTPAKPMLRGSPMAFAR